MIRVVIGDGRSLSRRGVRLVLEEQADMQVIAETSNGTDTVATAAAMKPDVVLLDASMPTLDALEVAAKIRQVAPDTEVLVLSNYMDEHLAADVFAAGAYGFLLTGDGPEDLVACVRSLCKHIPFISPSARAQLKTNLGRSGHAARLSPLTRRERMIVRLIAEGLRTREISEHLGISEKTVESHRAAIFRKLELDTLADVVRYAIRNSMIQV